MRERLAVYARSWTSGECAYGVFVLTVILTLACGGIGLAVLR